MFVRLLPGLRSGLHPDGARYLAPMAGSTVRVLDPTPNPDGDVLVAVSGYQLGVRVLPEFLEETPWP